MCVLMRVHNDVFPRAVMTWCTYLLATHPDVQERVYREVLHVLGPDGQLSFDTVNQLRCVYRSA